MNRVREQDIEKIIASIPRKDCIRGTTFLITGASGLLGSYIIDMLMFLNKNDLDLHCKIVALCRNKRKSERMFREYLNESCFRLVIQELDKEIAVEEDVDWIIHAASSTTTSSFSKIPVDLLGVNIVGTYNLLKLGKEKNIKGFLFLSSGTVQGNYGDDIKKIKEEDVFPLEFYNVENSYAVGKQGGEALCRAYWMQYNVPAKIVRIYHTYGPGIDENDERVFADFATKICMRKNLIIRGSGNDVRSFCYITDAIIAFFFILFKGKSGEIYNMANMKETYTIYELAEKLVNIAFPDRHLAIEAANLSIQNSSSKIEVDTGKLNGLGWYPKVDIVEGFRRMVRSLEDKELQ